MIAADISHRLAIGLGVVVVLAGGIWSVRNLIGWMKIYVRHTRVVRARPSRPDADPSRTQDRDS